MLVALCYGLTDVAGKLGSVKMKVGVISSEKDV